MSTGNTTGRQEEIAQLQECMETSQAQLILVHGRRGVGKTYLIDAFFDHQFALKVTGVNGENKSFQIRSFLAELR